jgi:hypothetical protein
LFALLFCTCLQTRADELVSEVDILLVLQKRCKLQRSD